jgi:hypothetical protein
MKSLLTAIIFLAASSTSISQDSPERYMFTGKLISAPANVAACGTTAAAYAYVFEVSMISDDGYAQTNIPIIVKCPDFLGENFFKPGATYKMELFNQGDNDGYSIMNEDVLEPFNLDHNYWTGDIKRTN